MKTVVSNRKPQRTAGFFWACKKKKKKKKKVPPGCGGITWLWGMRWGQDAPKEHSFLSGTFLDFEDCYQPTDQQMQKYHITIFPLDHILKWP